MDLHQKIHDFRTLFWMGYVNDDFAKIVISPRRNTIFSGLEVQKITEIVGEKPCEYFLANRMNFYGLETRFWSDFGGLGRGLGRL
jgi:hypothetical protein